jgi:hypothetical protein
MMIEVLCIFAKEPFLTVWSISSNFVEPPDMIPPAGPHIFDVFRSPFATEKLSMVSQIVQLFRLKTPAMFAQFLEPARMCLLSLYHLGMPTACKRLCSSAWTIA